MNTCHFDNCTIKENSAFLFVSGAATVCTCIKYHKPAKIRNTHLFEIKGHLGFREIEHIPDLFNNCP